MRRTDTIDNFAKRVAGRNINVLKEYDWGFLVNTNKKGNLSEKRALELVNPITMLNECEVCGRLSTPRRVCNRSDVYGWDISKANPFKSKTMLCVRCWNRAAKIQYERRLMYHEIWEAESEIKEINRLTKLLKKATEEA